MTVVHGRHAPLDLPPGVDKRPQRGARLPPLPAGHSARAYVEPQTARTRAENPRHAAPRQPRQKKPDLNALLAQLQAFREAKAQAVEQEDYAEAARLKQLITEIEVALEGAEIEGPAPPQPPPPRAMELAGSIYDQPRGVPARSNCRTRGSPDLSEDSSQAVATRPAGSKKHLCDASEAAQACVPPPRGGRRAKEGATASAVPVVDSQPESNSFATRKEEALGFETEDLLADDMLQGIVERNLLVQDTDVPSSADTVEDVDYGDNTFPAAPVKGYPAAVWHSGPAPTLDDLLSGNARKALRPVKEPVRGRSRPRPQRNGMNHVPVPPPLPRGMAGDPNQEEALHRGLEEKNRMHRRLDAIDRRQPLTAR